MPCSTTWPRPQPASGDAPRRRGGRLGAPADLAAAASWDKATVTRYGRQQQVRVAVRRCLRYGVFGAQQVRVVLVRETDPNDGKGGYDLALAATDLDTAAVGIVARYAARWLIEVAILPRQTDRGVGQARNRTPRAVERTVPFGLLCLESGHRVVRPGRAHPPRSSLSAADGLAGMPVKPTRRWRTCSLSFGGALIAAEFLPQHPDQPTSEQITAVCLAWEQAAA
ncbi:MAG: hypothetical protein ACRD0K_04445 [Egibacteraceae bacterium]